jgi:glycolate oxidase FAD binding subunit
MPPRSADLLLSTRKLNRIIEYEPADLTVTVESGLVLGELQQRLGVEGQLLALDPPNADRQTIGGVVASNASGPLRLQYGSARDLVIGTRVANTDGALTKAGGRVVKNVAGYDLNKLYTGSLGTLGMIVELSFKLHPLPQRRGAVLASFAELQDVATVVQRIMRSPLGPMSLAVLDPAAADVLAIPDPPTGGGVLLVQVGGFEQAVERVTKEIADYCRPDGRAAVVADEGEVAKIWSAVRELPDATDANQPVLKVAVPPARSLELLSRMKTALQTSGLEAWLLAYAGTGLVYARFAATDWDDPQLDRLATLVREIRAIAVEREGSLVIETGPVGLKQRVDAWGEIGPPLRLMRALKEKLDPTGTLNPGRYVGGI